MPKVTSIKTLSDITDVGFEWKPSYEERVKGYYIYRSNPKTASNKLERIATLNDRYISHYVDTKLEPNTEYYYRFSTFSAQKRESVPSEMVKVKTQVMISSVSFLEAIANLPNRVKLLWRPHPSQRVEAYLIERSVLSEEKWEQVGRVNGRLNAEFIDADLKDNLVFRYRVRVRTFDGLVSEPSKIVEAGTKPLPHIVRNLKASNNLPKKINLNWEESKTEDFAYYKVYRAINPLLFFNYVAKTDKNSYEDLINDNGKSYYYHVTAVDSDGLESPRNQNAVMGSTLSAPTPVYITSTSNTKNSISLSWRTTDKQSLTFNIIKEYSIKGNDQKRVITGISSNSYKDSDVIAGIKYTYTIYAVDQFGLESEPSEKTIITIPEDL